MKNCYKLLSLILLLLITKIQHADAQEKLSEFRSHYSLTYKYGIADGKDTKNWAKNSSTVQIGRSFALNKLLSLSPVVSYTHFGGTNFIKKSAVSLGGEVSIYPKYLATLITDNPYDAKNDKMYFNVGLQKPLNKSDHSLVFNADLNLFHINLCNKFTLSPNLGYQYFISSGNGIDGLGFYTVGVNFMLK